LFIHSLNTIIIIWQLEPDQICRGFTNSSTCSFIHSFIHSRHHHPAIGA
jgi:hypothetical protein